MTRRGAVLGALLALLLPVAAAAAECAVAPDTRWRAVEQAAWQTICRGAVADIAALAGGSAGDDAREIGADFLRAILLDMPWRDAAPAGISLRNAVINAPLRLQGAHVAKSLDFAATRFRDRVELDGSEIAGGLGFRDGTSLAKGITITESTLGPLSFEGAVSDGPMTLVDDRIRTLVLTRARAGAIRLWRDRIDFVVEASALSAAILNAQQLTVGDGLLFLHAHLDRLLFWQSHLNGRLLAEGLEARILNLTDSVIDEDVLIGRAAKIDRVVLNALQLAGPFNLNGAAIGTLDASFARFGSYVRLADSHIDKTADFSFARIDGALRIRNTRLAGLNLIGARVTDDFQLIGKDRAALWTPEAELILRDASVQAVYAAPDLWPERIDLRGFDYRTIGRPETPPAASGNDAGSAEASSETPLAVPDNTVSMAWRISDDLGWLARATPYAASPYEKLADVVEAAGDADQARVIRYAARDHDRAEAWQRGDYDRWFWLATQRVVIGYGYRLQYSLYWSALFLLLGIAVLRLSGEARRKQLGSGLGFSFDLLLPLVRLDEAHYRVELAGWARGYFALHRLIGFILGSFLLAGLGGLAK